MEKCLRRPRPRAGSHCPDGAAARVTLYLLESGIMVTTSGCTIYETARFEGYKNQAINYIWFRTTPRLIY